MSIFCCCLFKYFLENTFEKWFLWINISILILFYKSVIIWFLKQWDEFRPCANLLYFNNVFTVSLKPRTLLSLMHSLPGRVSADKCTKSRTERAVNLISGWRAIYYVQMEYLEEAGVDSSSLISNFRISTSHFTSGCCYKFKYNRRLFHFVANLSNTIITNTHTNTLITPWYYFYITKRATFYDAAMATFSLRGCAKLFFQRGRLRSAFPSSS